MPILNADSLAETIDRISEAFFFGKTIPKAQAEKAARWIAGRQGLPRSYAAMFAPTEHDFEASTKVFTGERLATRASIAHILGEEACRALILMDVDDAKVRDALGRATQGMLKRLPEDRIKGMYCCGPCSAAFWRHLSVGGLKNAERELTAGMKALKAHRLGEGKWRRFPFYYTLLALSEIDLPGAMTEMKYAAPVLERLTRRTPKDEKYALRRRELAERVLDRI